MSDHDLLAVRQAELLLMSHRTFALPVGRGMLTLGTSTPVATDPFSIPPIVSLFTLWVVPTFCLLCFFLLPLR